MERLLNMMGSRIKKVEARKEQIEITYFTDPMCCWSWALEPHWKKLLSEYKDQIDYSYRMGGLLKDWDSFSDPLSAVSKPVQMGPVWMEAKYISGMPIQDNIWIQDAPSSSYPACIAVKSAAQQSKVAEEKFLYALWEAAMAKGRNTSKVEVILSVAEALSKEMPDVFSFEAFRKDFNSKASRQAFREDLEAAKRHSIARFPTMIMKNRTGKMLQITGYRPYEVLKEAIQVLCS